MEKTLYRFEFKDGTNLNEIEDTIGLSIIAAGCLLGEAAVRLDFGYTVGPSRSTGKPCAVLGYYGDPGAVTTRIFVGFASHEYGNDSFRTLRISVPEAHDIEHKYPKDEFKPPACYNSTNPECECPECKRVE